MDPSIGSPGDSSSRNCSEHKHDETERRERDQKGTGEIMNAEIVKAEPPDQGFY